MIRRWLADRTSAAAAAAAAAPPPEPVICVVYPPAGAAAALSTTQSNQRPKSKFMPSGAVAALGEGGSEGVVFFLWGSWDREIERWDGGFW